VIQSPWNAESDDVRARVAASPNPRVCCPCGLRPNPRTGAREDHIFPPHCALTPAKTPLSPPLLQLPPIQIRSPAAAPFPRPDLSCTIPAGPLALFRPRVPSPKPQAAMDVNEEAMAAHKRAFLDFLDQDVSPLADPSAAAGSRRVLG
jgi:hypothetical protein